MSTKKANVQTIIEIFRAVEHRDEQRVFELWMWSSAGRCLSPMAGKLEDSLTENAVGTTRGFLCNPLRHNGGWIRA